MFKKGRIISHRGIHDNIKIFENTKEAIKLAKDKNYIIEIDIHLTKDNQIIVFHDYNTKRITKKDMIIEESNYNDLNKQNIIHIPLLKEILKLINGKVPLLIEIKQENKVGKLEQNLMNILKDYKGDYAIQSFNPFCIYWFKKHRKDYIRGQLLTNKYNYNFITNLIYEHMIFNIFTKPDFISYNIKGLPNKTISKSRKKLVVLGWTIKTKEELKKYENYCDNFICDNIFEEVLYENK